MGPAELEIGLGVLSALAAVGVIAGFVDAVAGGGGLLALPALLLAGVPPSMSLGTLKLQASFGALSAAVSFIRQGAVNLRRIRLLLLLCFVGGALGAITVQTVDPGFLRKVVPLLLVAIALYMLFARRVGETDRHELLSFPVFVCIFGPVLGFYDGFFGPGTGTFWAMAFVLLLGNNLVTATAQTKVANLTSNVAGLLMFILGGKVIWEIGLIMAVGQILGARLGAMMVLRQGAAFIRPMLVIMSLAITVRLIWQDADNPIRQFVAAICSAVSSSAVP